MHGWLDCRGELIKDGGPIDRQLVFGGDPDGHASLEAHGGEVDDVVLLGHPPASIPIQRHCHCHVRQQTIIHHTYVWWISPSATRS